MYQTYTRGNFRTRHGKVLRDLRTDVYDMSQADFGKHVLHCSAGMVSQMELGKIELSKRAKDLIDKNDMF